jgi:hypothetical protein
MSFVKIKPSEISGNVFERVGQQWLLITAGDKSAFNSMTASWGGMGVLWGRNVAHCYIRPQRHTRGFADNGEYFTLSFYPEKYRKLLDFSGIFGGQSGRDIDKVKESGFTPVVADCGAVYYEQAELVLVCRKLYSDDFKAENFTAPEAAAMYRDGDFHRFYVGEIIEVLENK